MIVDREVQREPSTLSIQYMMIPSSEPLYFKRISPYIVSGLAIWRPFYLIPKPAFIKKSKKELLFKKSE
jgi:hypothetical protein